MRTLISNLIGIQRLDKSNVFNRCAFECSLRKLISSKELVSIADDPK